MSIWTCELSIGNRAIDNEHRKLHGMINGAINLAAAKGVTALTEALDELENHLCAYFVVEERSAQAVNFDFSRHRIAHRQLLDEVRRIRSEAMANHCDCQQSKGYAHCLMNCLIRHIKEDGGPLKAVLNTHFYDFSP